MHEGLFKIEEEMPCLPSEIGIGHYFLPNTLGRAEKEEAAARILYWSKKVGEWVGVSWQKVSEEVIAEYEKNKEINEANSRNMEKIRRYNTKVSDRHRKICWTLCLYALFSKKPVRPELEEVPEHDLPFSCIFTHGPQFVPAGINELLDENLIRKEERGEGEDGFTVFFPTPKLISRILQVQTA